MFSVDERQALQEHMNRNYGESPEIEWANKEGYFLSSYTPFEGDFPGRDMIIFDPRVTGRVLREPKQSVGNLIFTSERSDDCVFRVANAYQVNLDAHNEDILNAALRFRGVLIMAGKTFGDDYHLEDLDPLGMIERNARHNVNLAHLMSMVLTQDRSNYQTKTFSGG
ncbi:hypothetical protein CMI45_02370 [Candidatus Pacearchaeota archaeon]|nr:hypothetical protein [Candidatus Pacearchaeota archaeon]|tara:strand:- start:76 stop:576 length:501 start_codon:yes stop_codon:yes gene_type:complete